MRRKVISIGAILCGVAVLSCVTSAQPQAGSIVAWGAGQAGQIGGFNYGQSIVPAGNSNYISVSAGQDFSLGLKADGSIVAWGDPSRGKILVPDSNSVYAGRRIDCSMGR
jgi:alpha-tubulin suppressor-like RCC1 family protein